MNDFIDNRDELRVKVQVPKSATKHGSLKGKIPLQVDPRTVVWVAKSTSKEKREDIVTRLRDHMGCRHYIDASGNMIRK